VTWHDRAVDEVRVDAWLWAVRLYKTRSAATAACRGGHVTVNGTAAKPATKVHAGDRVEARVAQRDRTLEVAQLIDKRVGAPAAAEAAIDHSPPAPATESAQPSLTRDRGTGRPTKRDRRAIDRFRG
jgi:ribosome-associated heat shock protein Hsp15